MGNIILLWIVALPLLGLAAWGAYYFFTDDYGRKSKPILGWASGVIGVIILTLSVVGTFQLTNTESFNRFKKSLDSEFQGGITREIIVYSEGGEEIYREQGKFDVEHRDNRLKWVDEQGKVQIIYLGNSSTAVVNELAMEDETKQ